MPDPALDPSRVPRGKGGGDQVEIAAAAVRRNTYLRGRGVPEEMQEIGLARSLIDNETIDREKWDAFTKQPLEMKQSYLQAMDSWPANSPKFPRNLVYLHVFNDENRQWYGKSLKPIEQNPLVSGPCR